jgi:serine/threonine-protein kinase
MERLGRYDIQSKLGQGAMGTVYRAHDPRIDRVVALKTITIAGLSGAAEEEFRKRFFREAQAAGKLSHPGIVTIHDVGEDDTTKTPFIVMEFIEGVTLDALGGAERLPLEKALTLVGQVAEALDYAHARQIVHRDIKPANIIVTPDGRAKITDFGVAKLQMSQFTQTGQVLGTPAYMAPEQITGGAVDGRTDLFALGVVLYWMITGEKPFPGDTTTAVTFKIVYTDPIAPSQLNRGLSADHDYLVARALAKDPAHRYQSGRQLADDLADLAAGRPPRSRAVLPPLPAPEKTAVQTVAAAPAPPTSHTVVLPPSPPATVAKTQLLRTTALPVPMPTPAAPSRKRWWLIGGAVAALLLLLLGVGIVVRNRSQQKGAEEAAVGTSAPTTSASPARKSATSSPRSRTVSPAPRQAEPRTRAMSSLRLVGEHNLDGATLYVYVDEALAEQIRLTSEGARKKGARVALGTISAAVPVSAGRHTISIRINAPRDDFDQIEHIQGEFEPGESRTLEISLGKLGKWVGIGELTRKLTLRWVD